jgi:DNA-directed RNA polymerase specialized sigma24 family protein
MKNSAAQPISVSSSSSLVRKWLRRLIYPCLTEKQRAVYELKMAGKKLEEIAAIRGISKPVVSKYLQACYRKLGDQEEGPAEHAGRRIPGSGARGGGHRRGDGPGGEAG